MIQLQKMDPAMQRSPCGSSAFLQMLQEIVENDKKCQQDGKAFLLSQVYCGFCMFIF